MNHRRRAMDIPDLLDRYNITWDSPSADSSGSMPLGNGDLALNCWVEADGDLLLLIAKADAWDENSTNLKLGRVRIALSPNPFNGGAPFRQTLDLLGATININAGSLGNSVQLRIWVDASQPVIRIEAQGDRAFDLRASLEIWRTQDRAIKTQTSDLFKQLGRPDPYPTVISADRIVNASDGRIIWCHHNERREQDGYEINMRLQGLGGFLDQIPHPLRGRTFGAAMIGAEMRLHDGPALVAPSPRKSHELSIHALTLHPATTEQWQQRLDQMIEQAQATDLAVARRKHEQWWQRFWDRSWIAIASSAAHEQEAAFQITQGYILQRFMNACAGRGAQPIKFNGSLFTVGKPDDPDFRRWGGPGFWFQNQRLIYWPMLASGDLDLLAPWLKMYRDMLPLQQHRTRTYFNHPGAHFPETITFWGAEVSAHYGWTPFEQRATPEAESSYVRYYWTCGLELIAMLHAHYLHTLDEHVAREMLLPIADAVLTFYDLHYPRGALGKLRIEPSQALETWQDATNSLPDVAGLHFLLPKLLDLPAALVSEPQRARWTRLLEALPPIPIGEKDDVRVLLPAERFDKLKNVENPELYAIFPFSIYGVGKPDLQLARDTFAARLHVSHECWSQDDVQMAMLGLGEQAKQFITRRAAPDSHSASRFPGFWDAHHDWIPDMDHGGVLQLALQSMLMQTDGRRIILLPAWPMDWDAEFKLHAPMRTIVQGKVKSGRLAELQVTPEHRRADIVIWSE
jgi:hypothetical protein